MVIWASDNGPETMSGVGQDFGAQSDSGPFRGEFPSGWEGAIRTPCIISWPGHTQVGVSNEIVSILDFYRTFANLVGAAQLVPTNRAIDSVDQTALFVGDCHVAAQFRHSDLGRLASGKISKSISRSTRLLEEMWFSQARMQCMGPRWRSSSRGYLALKMIQRKCGTWWCPIRGSSRWV